MTFFFNLKVVAATATTSINHIRGYKCKYQADLSPASSARGGEGRIRGFQPSLSHKHTYTHKFSKIKMNRSIINAFPCVVFFASVLVLRHLKVLDF